MDKAQFRSEFHKRLYSDMTADACWKAIDLMMGAASDAADKRDVPTMLAYMRTVIGMGETLAECTGAPPAKEIIADLKRRFDHILLSVAESFAREGLRDDMNDMFEYVEKNLERYTEPGEVTAINKRIEGIKATCEATLAERARQTPVKVPG